MHVIDSAWSNVSTSSQWQWVTSRGIFSDSESNNQAFNCNAISAGAHVVDSYRDTQIRKTILSSSARRTAISPHYSDWISARANTLSHSETHWILVSERQLQCQRDRKTQKTKCCVNHHCIYVTLIGQLPTYVYTLPSPCRCQ